MCESVPHSRSTYVSGGGTAGRPLTLLRVSSLLAAVAFPANWRVVRNDLCQMVCNHPPLVWHLWINYQIPLFIIHFICRLKLSQITLLICAFDVWWAQQSGWGYRCLTNGLLSHYMPRRHKGRFIILPSLLCAGCYHMALETQEWLHLLWVTISYSVYIFTVQVLLDLTSTCYTAGWWSGEHWLLKAQQSWVRILVKPSVWSLYVLPVSVLTVQKQDCLVR